MGNATIQVQLWETRAQDWATYVEQMCSPLFGAALHAACVTSGTRLLDAGYDVGLIALLDSFRGVQVIALDALPGLLAIARQRLSAADVQEGDVKALLFSDASFDAVTDVNSVFYAKDIAAASRELVRIGETRSPVPLPSSASRPPGAAMPAPVSTRRPLCTVGETQCGLSTRTPVAPTCVQMEGSLRERLALGGGRTTAATSTYECIPTTGCIGRSAAEPAAEPACYWEREKCPQR